MTQKDRDIISEIMRIRRQIGQKMKDIEEIRTVDDIFLSEGDLYLIQVYQDEIRFMERVITDLRKKRKPKTA